MKNLFPVLGLICIFMTGFSQTNSKNLTNGFYIVSERSSGNISSDTTTMVVRFNELFKENAPDNTGTLRVYRNNFVPLEFSKQPALVQQSDGSKRVELCFSKQSAEKLSMLTSGNVMKQATIIVNGEALTVHKIRTAITGGKLEISGCQDKECETLSDYLKKNVK